MGAELIVNSLSEKMIYIEEKMQSEMYPRH